MNINLHQNGWFIETAGGRCNRTVFEPEWVGPFAARPQPVRRFMWEAHADEGWGRFEAVVYAVDNDETVTVVRHQWFPEFGYCWNEAWERADVPVEPPLSAAKHAWTGTGWRPISIGHPTTR